jgi:peptidoglycan/LPS O-acetylase OafA/YrhL
MIKENNGVSRLSYLPQLDSFRFFAVFLVIVSHWLPGNKVNNIPNGFLGVTFFFVLSGFLISTNLLLTKQKITSKKLLFQDPC